MSSLYLTIIRPLCFTFVLIWALVAYAAIAILLVGLMQGDATPLEVNRLATIAGASATLSLASGLLHSVLRYVFTYHDRYY